MTKAEIFSKTAVSWRNRLLLRKPPFLWWKSLFSCERIEFPTRTPDSLPNKLKQLIENKTIFHTLKAIVSVVIFFRCFVYSNWSSYKNWMMSFASIRWLFIHKIFGQPSAIYNEKSIKISINYTHAYIIFWVRKPLKRNNTPQTRPQPQIHRYFRHIGRSVNCSRYAKKNADRNYSIAYNPLPSHVNTVPIQMHCVKRRVRHCVWNLTLFRGQNVYIVKL